MFNSGIFFNAKMYTLELDNGFLNKAKGVKKPDRK